MFSGAIPDRSRRAAILWLRREQKRKYRSALAQHFDEIRKIREQQSRSVTNKKDGFETQS